MFAYRFKINFEEQDGFAREIELRVDQTFLDFYNIIADNVTLDRTLSTSFFLCDHRYRKKREMFHPNRADQLPQPQEGQPAHLFMDKCVLNEFIDDPHQKFLLVYDLKSQWSFYIELMKITPAQQGEEYPRITRSIGGVPDEISRKPKPLPGLDDEEDMEFEEEFDAEMEDQEDESEETEVVYAEEDMDEFDDSGFYQEQGGEEGTEDFDETKF